MMDWDRIWTSEANDMYIQEYCYTCMFETIMDKSFSINHHIHGYHPTFT